MKEGQSDSPAKLTQTAPYFLVRDVFATAEYYRDTLGFTITGFYGEPPSFTLRDARRDVALVQAAYAGSTLPSLTARRIP